MSWWEKEYRRSIVGTVHPVWVERRLRMPRIPDESLDVAVYCYKSEQDARDGKRAGGSGFLLGLEAESKEPLSTQPILPAKVRIGEARDIGPLTGRWFYYAVTCGHVAEIAPVVRINTRSGEQDIVPLRKQDWIFHKSSDLAIAAVDLRPRVHSALPVPVKMLLTAEESNVLEVGIGDDIFCIGRFINHEGRQTNRPTARFGHISMMPGELVQVGGMKPQEAYLIEMRTISGYSGSPVFFEVPRWELAAAAEGSPRRIMGDKALDPVRLLGVAGGYIHGRNETIAVRIGGQDFRGFRAEWNSGMMWCIPAWRLLDLLNRDDVRAQRDEQRREWTAFPPAGAPA